MKIARLTLLVVVVCGSLLVWRVRPKPVPPYQPIQCFEFRDFGGCHCDPSSDRPFIIQPQAITYGCWQITECNDLHGHTWSPRADNACYAEDAR